MDLFCGDLNLETPFLNSPMLVGLENPHPPACNLSTIPPPFMNHSRALAHDYSIDQEGSKLQQYPLLFQTSFSKQRNQYHSPQCDVLHSLRERPPILIPVINLPSLWLTTTSLGLCTIEKIRGGDLRVIFYRATHVSPGWTKVHDKPTGKRTWEVLPVIHII